MKARLQWGPTAAFFARVLWALLVFVIVVVDIKLHLRTVPTNAIQTAVSGVLANAGAESAGSVTDLPAAVSQLSQIGSMSFVVPEGVAGVPTVGLHNVLLGGVRMSQSRFASVACPDASVYAKIASISGNACFSSDESTADFGIALDPAFANNTLTRAFQYRPREAARFSGALTAPSGSLHPYFIVFPSIAITSLGTDVLLNQLSWFDAATSAVDFYFVVLNSDLGAWTEVLVSYELELAGAISVRAQTKTLWNAAAGSNTNGIDGVFLALIVLQFIELAVRLCLAAWSLLSLYRRLGRAAAWAEVRTLLLPGLGAALVFSIDVVTVALMLAAYVGVTTQRSLAATVTSTIASSSWTAATFEADTVLMHDSIADVAASQARLESLAIALVVFAALKFIAVCSAPFAVSSRLGNVQRAFARAAPDLFSAGVLVALAMATFGLVGQILYAAAVRDWSTSLGAGLSLFRAFNGEGSTDAMYSVAPTSTAIFYPAIYIILQSSLLALFFAILADSFSSVRESTEAAASDAEAAAAAAAATDGQKAKARAKNAAAAPALPFAAADDSAYPPAKDIDLSAGGSVAVTAVPTGSAKAAVVHIDADTVIAPVRPPAAHGGVAAERDVIPAIYSSSTPLDAAPPSGNRAGEA